MGSKSIPNSWWKAIVAFGRAAVESAMPKKRRARDAGDAVGAAGEDAPVEQDDPDDLAEAEGHDGEIVAAQAQHREAQQDAEVAASRPASGRQSQKLKPK